MLGWALIFLLAVVAGWLVAGELLPVPRVRALAKYQPV